MNNTLHTPAPWKCDLVSLKIWANDGNTEIARTSSDVSIHEEEANAHLISAAPDLLSALERLLQISQEELDQSATHDGLVNCEALANARVAIAKAKGAA
jgi:ATP/maltotriose-dependent transcriptional regulator MalT